MGGAVSKGARRAAPRAASMVAEGVQPVAAPASGSAARSAAASAPPPSVASEADIRARIDAARPELYKRMDGRDDIGRASVGEEPLFDAAAPGPRSNAEADAVAAAAGTSGPVSVQKIVPSGPVMPAAHLVHERNAVTVENVNAVSPALHDAPLRDAGTRNFQLYQAMQMNPKLLDSGVALASSAAHLIAAQMAVGIIPPAALPEGRSVQEVRKELEAAETAAIAAAAASVPRLPAPDGAPSDASSPLPASTPLSASAALAAEAGVDVAADAGARAPSASSIAEARKALALARIEQADAIVPAHTTVDALLLRQEAPAHVVEWGARPSEGSPYDQLVLYNEDAEFQLDQVSLFELFARHKADAAHWTPARLALKYNTKEEWVEVLLRFAAPPIYAQVDGRAYGVYEVKELSELTKPDELK